MNSNINNTNPAIDPSLVDEDSRTSVHSGISGHSEHSQNTSLKLNQSISNQLNSDRPPSRSSNSEQNNMNDEPSPGPSGIQKPQSKEEEMVSFYVI